MQDIIVIQNQFGTKAIHRFKSMVTLDKEQVFEALNGYGSHRHLRNLISYSMTARDYLCLDGDWWFCAPSGWEPMFKWEIDLIVNDVLYGTWDRR